MRLNIILVAFLIVQSLSAQESEKQKIRSQINTFFESFHERDTSTLKELVHPKIIMQTMSITIEGERNFKEEDFDVFLNNMVRIPDSTRFEEKLLNFNIQRDRAMAHVWTPYEFWVNGQFSHCGVNSFQLIKEKDDWKILYIIDTRHRNGCAR